MVLALDYTPQSATDGYPVPGTLVTLTATGATGTSREFQLTSAPSQSTLSLTRLTDASGAAIDTFTPDQPGEYVFTVYDYRDTGFAPARWTGDITAQRGKKLIAKATGTVYVGENVDLPIVTLLGHGATLRITIVNDTVRVASLVNPLTEISRLAILVDAVTNGLAGMVTSTVAALGNNLSSGAAQLATCYDAHRIIVSSVHVGSGDQVNAMLRTTSSAYASHAYAITQLNEIRDRLEQHMRSGSASGSWHRNDDTVYHFQVGPASDIASATVLLADAGYRVFERHRTHVNSPAPSIHIGADATNVLTAAAPLTTLIVAYLDAIEEIDPNIPAGESEGAGDAAHMYGFVRAT